MKIAAIFFAALVLVLSVHALWFYSTLGWDAVDDAYISYVYAHNAILGHGLTFNPSERVEGFSNFLWTAMMVPIVGLNLDVGRISSALGVAFGVGVLALAVRFPRWLGVPAVAGWLAALFLAVDGSFALWTVSGLETPMFAFLITLGAFLYVQENFGKKLLGEQFFSKIPLCGFVFALAAMTRPEAAAVFALTAAHQAAWRLLDQRKLVTREDVFRIGSFIAVFVPYWLIRWRYYHSLLPNSFYAKVSVGGPIAQIMRGWEHVEQFVGVHLGWVILVPAVIALAVVVVRYVKSAGREGREGNKGNGGNERTETSAGGQGTKGTGGKPAREGREGNERTETSAGRQGTKGNGGNEARGERAGTEGNEGINERAGTKGTRGTRGSGEAGKQVDRETRRAENKGNGGNGGNEARAAFFGFTYFAALILFYGAYIVYVGGDWSVGRFFVPMLAFVYLMIATGLYWIVQFVVERAAPASVSRISSIAAGTGILLALGLLYASSYNGEYRIFIGGFDAGLATEARITAGKWLKQNVPPGTWIAVDAAGQVPYFSELPTIDMFGINDLHIGRMPVANLGSGTPGHEKFDLGYIIARAPKYVAIYGTLFDSVTEYRRANVTWTDNPELEKFLTIYERVNAQ